MLADEVGRLSLLALGARSVPVVSRGDQWVDGQALQALADFVGVRWQHRMLSPKDLASRIDTVLAAASRFSGQLPADKMSAMLPNGFRSYASLATHVSQIIEAFLDFAEHGTPLEEAAYVKAVPSKIRSPADLAAFHEEVRARFGGWWRDCGSGVDFARPAAVYYGEQTMHEFMERSAWHAAQHARQLQLLLQTLGVSPDVPFGAADLAGLPLPENVWDDKMAFQLQG